jgi:hypothetical protein
MWYIQTLLVFIKKGNSGTCYSIDKPARHFISKRETLYDSTYSLDEVQIYRNRL